MKYLGIDYGSKWIGLAVSNREGTIAFPRVTLSHDEKLRDAVLKFVKDEEIESIVIGDTRAIHGGENTITKDAEAFIADLKKFTVTPIETVFEAWSSIEASRYAPQGVHDDAAAAAIILQRFFDMRKK